ncbi:conserved Plasmodium protein, unknown function [Plasmodium sp. DRC-Itaito]|nr:conserved Plasmodium protein, unknown function [Plasmodium sp. DRC-Itaito]
MENLYFSDINTTLFLRHYNNHLLLINGNKIKFYNYEENKNIVRAHNIGIYSIKEADKNEKIVYVSNNIKLKRRLKGKKEEEDLKINDSFKGNDLVSSNNNETNEKNREKEQNKGDIENNNIINNNNMNDDVLSTSQFSKTSKDMIIKEEKVNYVCIAFEEGNVWLCHQDDKNKLFNYEKLIYRKVCDIVNIELFVIKNNLNVFILYKDYTLILYSEKLQNAIKIPIHEYTYNFCLSHNYKNLAIFNHANLYIYDIYKSDVFGILHDKDNYSPTTNNNNNNNNNNNSNNFIEIKNIFDLSKNYKYLLNCDWHPKNHCIALCGKKNIRYLTLYNYNVYEFTSLPIHETLINSMKFITISNNVTLLISLSSSDYIFSIWEFELEYCIYKFKSDYAISYFDMSFFNNYLHISMLAQEKHLANLKLLDKDILQKIECNQSDNDHNDILQGSFNDKNTYNNNDQNIDQHNIFAEHKNNINLDNKNQNKEQQLQGIIYPNGTMHTKRKSKRNDDDIFNSFSIDNKNDQYFYNNYIENDKITNEYASASVQKKKRISISNNDNFNSTNMKKRKKKIFSDDDESQESFPLSYKNIEKEINANEQKVKENNKHLTHNIHDKHDNNYKPDGHYKNDRQNHNFNDENDKDDASNYNYEESAECTMKKLHKLSTHLKSSKETKHNKVISNIYDDFESNQMNIQHNIHSVDKSKYGEDENIYNPKEYNLQNFINKNRDVVIDRDGNYLFDNDDDQRSMIGFNTYVKDKFDQLRELKKQVDHLQKQITNYTKINLDDFIVLAPGLCEEPENINDQWCMFWNDIGHITKKKEGSKTYIYIFLFRGEEIGKKKITDIYNVTSASLSAYGFALASNPYEKSGNKNNSILCFHNLKDNIIWNKYLPSDEYIKGVANGNNFVAVVTSNNFLRIYSTYGYIINTILLKGLPVAICAYDYLLFIITCPYIYENVTTTNINNTYTCTLYKIYENFTNLKPNKYNTYHITILYEDVLSLPSCHYLNWVNMSNFGVPYVKDTSNYIYGLYPIFKKNNQLVYDWVPVFDMQILNEVENKENILQINENNQDILNESNNNNDIMSSHIHSQKDDNEDYVNSNMKNATPSKLNALKKKNKNKSSNHHGNNNEGVMQFLDDEVEEDEEENDAYEDEELGNENFDDEEDKPRINNNYNNNNNNDEYTNNGCIYYPLYFDNFEQISVIKLQKNEIEPRSNKIESCLGYNVEKKYVVMNECNLISYEKYVNLLQKNPNLSLDNESNNEESALLPWEQYDEMRSRIDLFCKQLFANMYHDYMNDGKNKTANDTLKSLNKLYDKWIMRMFAILKNDKKNQRLAVKVSSLFKNIKNMMLSISLVDDEYSTLHSEITNEYLKRQIKDENSKHTQENIIYYEDNKDDEQKRREIYEKSYANQQNNISDDEKKNLHDIKSTSQVYINSSKTFVEKKENGFLDKFFTGVTKNQAVDTLFSHDKKNTKIKKKSTLESFFTEIKEN